jgi:hypothetical protein
MTPVDLQIEVKDEAQILHFASSWTLCLKCKGANGNRLPRPSWCK